MTKITAQYFLSHYPEFSNTDLYLIQNRLDNAYSRTQSVMYGKAHTRAVMLLTARLLALSPDGEPARLSSDGTIYDEEFKTLRRAVTMGKGRVS